MHSSLQKKKSSNYKIASYDSYYQHIQKNPEGLFVDDSTLDKNGFRCSTDKIHLKRQD